MTASDLRIGNWVHQGDGFAMQVVAIFLDEVFLNFEGNEGDVWECKIKDLHGFEWNTEWLGKLGFRKRLHENLWDLGNFSYWIIYDMWYWRGDVLRPDLTKYVHQVQNLHYALKGEEL